MPNPCPIDEHEWIDGEDGDIVCRVCDTRLEDAGETEAMRENGEFDDDMLDLIAPEGEADEDEDPYDDYEEE